MLKLSGLTGILGDGIFGDVTMRLIMGTVSSAFRLNVIIPDAPEATRTAIPSNDPAFFISCNPAAEVDVGLSSSRKGWT